MKVPVVILCSWIQGPAEETLVIRERISSGGQVPSNHPVVVPKSMKGNPELRLKKKRGQRVNCHRQKNWEQGHQSPKLNGLPRLKKN